jgi:hypothetical protein
MLRLRRIAVILMTLGLLKWGSKSIDVGLDERERCFARDQMDVDIDRDSVIAPLRSRCGGAAPLHLF